MLQKVQIGKMFKPYVIQNTLSPEFNLKEKYAAMIE